MNLHALYSSKEVVTSVSSYLSTYQGLILVNEARILEADVEAKNGRLYSLDAVLIPPSVEPLLPHRCNVTSWKIHQVSIRSDGLCYFSTHLHHSHNHSL